MKTCDYFNFTLPLVFIVALLGCAAPSNSTKNDTEPPANELETAHAAGDEVSDPERTSGANLCRENNWYLRNPLAGSVALLASPTFGELGVCLTPVNTVVDVTTPFTEDSRLGSNVGWFFVSLSDANLSCSSGYASSENIVLGTPGCVAPSFSLAVSSLKNTAPRILDSPSLNASTLLCIAFENTEIVLSGDLVADPQIPALTWQPINVLNGHCVDIVADSVVYVDSSFIR